MTQEDKQLLLKDLCARLLYKLHCRVFKLNGDIKENDDILYGVIGDNVMTLKSDKDECLMYYQIKPYLRPMSSMTKEEAEEFYKVTEERFTFYPGCEIYDHIPAFDNDCTEFDTFNDDSEYKRVKPEHVISCIDFLNSRHFDYRGLITKGLALEAPEGMYC